MTKKHVSLLVVFVLLFTTLFSSFAFAADEDTDWEVAEDITIKANYHQQTYGDQEATGKGSITFGKIGESKRLEAISLGLEGAPEDMEIRYGVHAQTYGDLPKDGLAVGPAIAGTKGEAKRLEGVQIGLYKKGTDELYPGYQISYQVHMKGYGWGADADKNAYKGDDGAFKTNGEFAGTKGLARWIEAVSIVVEKIAKLSVSDVSASNLKQVEVEFNQDIVDNKEVEDKENYSLETDKGKDVEGQDGKDIEIEDVEINGSTAVVTFTSAVENQTHATLVIDKAVVGEEVKQEVYFDDRELPTVEDAEVIGENTVKVIFSEPVDAKTATQKQFEVESEDGKTDYRVKNVTFAKNNSEVLIEVRKDFVDGDEVVLTIDNDIKDYAGLRVVEDPISLTVVEDNSAIEIVDFRQATEDGIILIFNKNIMVDDDDEDNFYHTNSKNPVDKDGVKADGKELKLTFTDHELPSNGSVTVFVDGDSLKDYWGNTNEKTLSYEVKVSEDKVNPTIKKVSVADDGRSLTVEFDKRMDEDSAEDEDNYSMVFENTGKKVEDTKIYRATLKDDDKTVEIRFSGDALDAGKYILKVAEDVEDIRGNGVLEGEKSFTLEGAALTANDVLVRSYTDSDRGDVEYTIVVDYQRQMDTDDTRYAVDLLDNYSVLYEGKLTTLADLNEEDDYSVDLSVDDDDEVVEITIEAEDEKSSNEIKKITISRVKDANGLLSEFASCTKDITDADNDTIAIKEQTKATALDKIEIKLNKAIDEFEEEDIQLQIETSGGNGNYTDWDGADDIELSDDGKKITVTLENDLDYDGKVDGKGLRVEPLAKEDSKSESKYGEKLVILQDNGWNQVNDGIKPVFDEDYNKEGFEDGVRVLKATGNPNLFAIELKFKEALVAVPANGEELLRGSFKLDDIDRDLYRVSTNGDVLTITVTGKDYTKLLDTTVNLTAENALLKDAAGNNVGTFNIPVVWDKKDNWNPVTRDTEAPVLHYDGETTITLENGAEFTTPPAVTATDNVDTDVNVVYVIKNAAGTVLDKIDTKVAGIYTITYTAKDNAGNTATLEIKVTVLAAGEFTAVVNGNYNPLFGYINLTVSDSAKIASVNVGTLHKDATDITKVRVYNLDTKPESIVLTLVDGKTVTVPVK